MLKAYDHYISYGYIVEVRGMKAGIAFNHTEYFIGLDKLSAIERAVSTAEMDGASVDTTSVTPLERCFVVVPTFVELKAVYPFEIEEGGTNVQT